jgi:hypothetical protein
MEMNPEIQLSFDLPIPERETKVFAEATPGSITLHVVSYNILADELACKY